MPAKGWGAKGVMRAEGADFRGKIKSAQKTTRPFNVSSDSSRMPFPGTEPVSQAQEEAPGARRARLTHPGLLLRVGDGVLHTTRVP